MASPSFSPETRPNISVLVGPGLRAFTRIFLSASSALMVLAKLESPALIADVMLVVGQAVLTTKHRVPVDAGPVFGIPYTRPDSLQGISPHQRGARSEMAS